MSSAAPAETKPTSIFYMARKAYQKVIPFTAVLELTYRCNFRCTMCYVIHSNTKGELNTQEWCDVLDQLAEMGTLYLELTGGEIFLRRDIWEILDYAQQKRFLLHLFTNASYINEERAERLKKYTNIMGFSVSLYGGDKQTFDQVTHVRGAWDRVVRALDILRQHGFKVRTKTPVTKENYATIDGMRSLAKGALCSSYECAPLITPRDDGRDDPCDERIDDEAMREIVRVQASAGYDDKKTAWDSATCSAGRSLIAISPMGDVSPCIEFSQKVGNLRDKPIKQLWQSPQLDYVRQFSWGQMEKCQHCSVTQFCSPCVGLNQQEQGRIDAPSQETCRITTLIAETYREKKRLKVLPSTPAQPEEHDELSHCAL